MSRPGSSGELRVAIQVLRALRDWSQEELAAASGVHRAQISLYEAGKRRPTPKTLARLVAASGVSPAAFQALLAVLGQILAGKEIQASTAEGSAGPVLQAVAAAQESARVRVLAATARRAGPRSPEALRREAADSWERLKAFSGQDRRVLVDGAPEYQTWALCELLCEQSLGAAASDPRQAIELANLAVRVAGRVTGEESWRSRLQGYALAHLGNSRRAADDFEGAEAAFRRAWSLWQRGTEGDPGGLLDRGLIFYLQASLRKDQRRFSEAQSLSEQALAHAGSSLLGDVLLHQAFALEQMGEYSRAIEALEKAKQHIDARRSPRSAFGIR
ncbi:MAG TPA: helix-turn-helix transcriptional regulator, partial [Thermoanaerobaculia bacterium]|nr:helix-turn-helix transcriptional regulator [Thermoanaerobaculia bacterium]